MKTKLKQINTVIVSNLATAFLLLMIASLTHFKWEYAFYTAAGIMVSSVFTIYFQKFLVYSWVYPLRFVLQGVAISFTFFLITLFMLINSYHTYDLAKILLIMAFGLGIGLIFGLIDYLGFAGRKQKILYTGTELPILVSRANLWESHLVISKGMSYLLPDRFLFLGKDQKKREVFFSDIQGIEVQINIYFPFRLDLQLKDAEMVSVAVSMSYIWKKKIEMAMNFQPVELG